MIRYSGTVVLEDGTRTPFETGMKGARAWEAYASRHDLPLNPRPEAVDRFPLYTWQLVIAHAALAIEAGVDAWGNEVAGVDDWAAADVPPTRAAVSAVP